MRFILLSTVAATLFSCAPVNNGELAPLSSVKADVSKEGTIANPSLAQDTSLAIRRIMGGNARVIKFVIQQPVGLVGRKAWREIWDYDPEGIAQKFVVTFREDGEGSADFELQKI